MIIRRRHTANFTTIGNALFEDERLQADEVGILAYLLSRPNDWEVRRPALMRRWRMGREAIKRVVTNWLRTGWAQAQRVRLANGTTYVIYEIRDEPGPSLSDEEVRRALSLESSEAATENEENEPDIPLPETSQPATGYPSPVDPSPVDPYVVDNKELNTELPRKDSNQIEREHARAKEKHAANLAEFKRRYPTTASDDQTRIDAAWFKLTFAEGEAALAGIPSFLDRLKRDHRTKVPAAWKYLEERRWELLEQPKTEQSNTAPLAAGSPAAKAVALLYELSGNSSAINGFMRGRDGSIYYLLPVTPQLLALAQAPAKTEWVTLDYKQAGSWNGLINEFVKLSVRGHLKEGDRAPWPWAPSKDGTIYAATAPPETLMSEADIDDLGQLGKMTG